MSNPLQVGDADALAGRVDDAIPSNVIPPAAAALPSDADAKDREANFDDDTATLSPTDEATSTVDTTGTSDRTARTTVRETTEKETTTIPPTTSSEESTTTSSKETSSTTSIRRVQSSTTETTSTTEESTTSETSTTSRETSTSIEDKVKHTTREPTKETPTPVPTKLPSKPASKDDDGLGTGTTIGIALAAAAGIGILLLIIGALLKWRQKRNVARRTAGLANFADINDFADSTTKKNPIDLANEQAARDFTKPDTNTIPVTPPYRPDVRQAQKRNSWVDDRGLPDDASFGDYTVQSGLPVPMRSATTGQPAYGGSRSGMPLPGMFDTPPSGGAFDPIRVENGYGHHGVPERQDTFSTRAAAPPRNRHFPPAPGRAYTSENPYPYMPTGHRQ